MKVSVDNRRMPYWRYEVNWYRIYYNSGWRMVVVGENAEYALGSKALTGCISYFMTPHFTY